MTEYKEGRFPEALELAYEHLDTKLLDLSRIQNWYDGTTSITAMMVSGETPRLYVANAGDCRAIVVLRDGKCYPLSRDHNPSKSYEKNRVVKAGGVVVDGRIEHQLSVSRGFGDRQFKEPKKLVIPTPDVVSVAIDPDLKFLILACDGLWTWVSNLQAARFVNLHLKEGMKPNDICKELTKYAIESGSSDNVTVILVVFNFNNENGGVKHQELWDIKVIEDKKSMSPFVQFHVRKGEPKRVVKRSLSMEILIEEDKEEDKTTENSPTESPDIGTRRAHSIDLSTNPYANKTKKKKIFFNFKKDVNAKAKTSDPSKSKSPPDQKSLKTSNESKKGRKVGDTEQPKKSDDKKKRAK